MKRQQPDTLAQLQASQSWPDLVKWGHAMHENLRRRRVNTWPAHLVLLVLFSGLIVLSIWVYIARLQYFELYTRVIALAAGLGGVAVLSTGRIHNGLSENAPPWIRLRLRVRLVLIVSIVAFLCLGISIFNQQRLHEEEMRRFETSVSKATQGLARIMDDLGRESDRQARQLDRETQELQHRLDLFRHASDDTTRLLFKRGDELKSSLDANVVTQLETVTDDSAAIAGAIFGDDPRPPFVQHGVLDRIGRMADTVSAMNTALSGDPDKKQEGLVSALTTMKGRVDNISEAVLGKGNQEGLASKVAKLEKVVDGDPDDKKLHGLRGEIKELHDAINGPNGLVEQIKKLQPKEKDQEKQKEPGLEDQEKRSEPAKDQVKQKLQGNEEASGDGGKGIAAPSDDAKGGPGPASDGSGSGSASRGSASSKATSGKDSLGSGQAR